MSRSTTSEDLVLAHPAPTTLQRILETKRGLIELRRVLANTRDVAAHLQRLESDLIPRSLSPFLTVGFTCPGSLLKDAFARAA